MQVPLLSQTRMPNENPHPHQRDRPMNFTCNSVDLFESCGTVGMTKELSKRFWGQASILGECRPRLQIIEEGDFFDGCHLFPAGEPRWRHLRNLPANVWPMARNDHRPWDMLPSGNVRTPKEKIVMLVEKCNHEHRELITEIVRMLSEMAESGWISRHHMCRSCGQRTVQLNTSSNEHPYWMCQGCEGQA